MNSAKLVKKFILPCGLCAMPITESGKEPTNLSMENTNKNLIRPSELSIYVKEDLKPVEKTCEDNTPSFLEQGFGTIRRSVRNVMDQTTEYTDVITGTIDTGIAHSQQALEYLQEDSNQMPRMGAVSIGGLAGLILGLRGGKVKKLLYTATGALAMAAVCYPREAQDSFGIISHYTKILYNFICGVKPGDDNQMSNSWSDVTNIKIPSNISELMDAMRDSKKKLMDKFFEKKSESLTQQKEDGDISKVK